VCVLFVFLKEPTDDWDVEQVMHWWLLRAHAESEASCDDVVSRLVQQLDEGKASLWKDHTEVSEIMNGGGGGGTSNENADPQQRQMTTTMMTAMSNEKISGLGSDTIRIEIVGGAYQGTSYDLQPKTKLYAWVGRSQGKKFRDKGISLVKDLEVSTTHGRFESRGSKFVYVDTGSTNGSRFGHLDIEPNKPLELQTGMEITVGQTVMRVTVTY
jgi:hypothetical protein